MSNTVKKTVTSKKLRNDIILVAVIAVITATGLLFFGLNKEEGKRVTVSIDGEITATYSLSENIEVTIPTGENYNTLVIKNNKAQIVRADCPDGICVETRAISYVGETIVCLPHKLVVEVIGDTETEIDVAV